MMGGSNSTDRCIDVSHKTELMFDVDDEKVPIVYYDIYNITFGGIEKLHPFDSCKWGHIIDILVQSGYITKDKLIQPREASNKDLLMVHTERYLSSLTYSATVAGIIEMISVALIPNFIVQKKLLSHFRYQVGGTVIAAKVAVERGWAFNVGGGFHHCSGDCGGGYCLYADITLAIKLLRQHVESIKRVMIIDLDAHQGNGHERDFLDDSDVYVLDVYNAYEYPQDEEAKKGISKDIGLEMYTGDEVYLDVVSRSVEEALSEFETDFILYNAGTDILEGDPEGFLSVTSAGVIQRDEIVFKAANKRDIPIAMVTSGGYLKQTAQIIADSILNLDKKGLLPLCKRTDPTGSDIED